jgi:hypothetical protein
MMSWLGKSSEEAEAEGYLEEVILEDDVRVFHEGGDGEGSLRIIPKGFSRFVCCRRE